MSTYQFGQGRVTTRRVLTPLISEACNALAGVDDYTWVNSAILRDLARGPVTDEAAHDIDMLTHRIDTLMATPMAISLVQSANATGYRAMENLVADARLANTVEDTVAAAQHAAAAHTALSLLLDETSELLAVDERVVVRTSFINALDLLGYDLSVHEGDRSTGIFATRGDVALAVLAHDGGAVETDWVGCAGGECIAPMNELVAAVASVGLEMSFADVTRHGDDRGGQLVGRAASAAVHGNRARGLVEQFENGDVAQVPDLYSNDGGRNRVFGGGA